MRTPRKKGKTENDNDKHECKFFAVTECPCGQRVACCIRHGGVYHFPPHCREYRDMERGAYLDYISREMAKTLFSDADADSESWPRA